MGKINRGILRITALVVVLASLLILVVPVLAKSPAAVAPPISMHTVQGKVVEVSNTSTSFTVLSEKNTQVTIVTNTSTKFYIINMGKAQSYVNSKVAQDVRGYQKEGFKLPSLAAGLKDFRIPANWRDNLGWLDSFDTQADFSDVEVGDRVIARITNDGSNLAKQVLIVKAPVIRAVKGKVQSVTESSISIAPDPGSAVLTLNIEPETRITLKGTGVIQQGQVIVAVYNSKNGNLMTATIQALK
jgi:hypothetical protein